MGTKSTMKQAILTLNQVIPAAMAYIREPAKNDFLTLRIIFIKYYFDCHLLKGTQRLTLRYLLLRCGKGTKK